MADFISPSGRKYLLTFEDNFDGDTLDLTKWTECPEMKRQDIGGEWKHGLAQVHDGNLWLWAKQEEGKLVSGGIRSKGKFEQAYGYFESRVMFPRITGFWCAFWMMCGDVKEGDGTGKNGTEIDIIESGECPREGVNHALHWNGYRKC